MLYIFLTLLSGIFSGLLAIYFRSIEIQKKVILVHKQLFTQIAVFIGFLFLFQAFFTNIFIDLGFITLSWVLIYAIFSSVGFYGVQVFYEYFSGNSFFATEQEMQDYLEKLEDENNF